MTIDQDKITQAVLDTGCSPLALEEGSGLVDSYIERFPVTDKTIGVECGWSVQIDPKTFAIGVMDFIGQDDRGIYGREFKTTKEPSKYWNEDKWLDDIKSGHQIAFYALALNRGVFYEADKPPFVIHAAEPIRMAVRAAVKTTPPIFWPHALEDEWLEFSLKDLDKIADAIVVKAEVIRAARRTNKTPWQLTGKHCIAFNRECVYFNECSKFNNQAIGLGFDSSDPAARLALPNLPEMTDETVILSASAYGSYSRCMELGRLDAQSQNKEQSIALDIGTVFHAGIASYHQQLREIQSGLV